MHILYFPELLIDFFSFANRKMDISQEKDRPLIRGNLLQVESKLNL